MVLSYVQKADRALFLLLNGAHRPYLDRFFGCATLPLFWVPFFLVLLACLKRKQKISWKGVALFGCAILAADQCSAAWLKPLFQRYRPCCVVPLVRVVGTYEGVYGFPSSHASNAFAVAWLFWKWSRDVYPCSFLVFVWAALVAYGRIYEGVHYPLDCVGGAALGIGIGLWIDQIHRLWSPAEVAEKGA